jgi:3-deoxy-D-manno-octulosonate 8-phosphate phosphatase (KDO 8-P phosphatase)
VKEIRAVALDVDGVLTDGSFLCSQHAEEFKRFSFQDIMGISLGRKSGLIFALISGEDSPILDHFAAKLGIIDVYKGCKDKAGALRDFAQRHNLELRQVCYMGDDINDASALESAGLAAAPANAHDAARTRAALVTQHKGGEGAVRELVDLILLNNIIEA